MQEASYGDSIQAERIDPTPFKSDRKVLSVQRRRELVALAQKASDWLVEHEVGVHELCFFRKAVEMLHDTRENF